MRGAVRQGSGGAQYAADAESRGKARLEDTRLCCLTFTPPRLRRFGTSQTHKLPLFNCSMRRFVSRRCGHLLAAAALALAACPASGIPTYVYTDALAPGWTAQTYTAGSGVVNTNQSAVTHVNSASAISAQLKPYGTLILLAPSPDALLSTAALAFYVLFSAPSSGAALGISIATWLGTTSSPIATLCSVRPSTTSSGATATPSLGAGSCTSSDPDGEGWVRIQVNVSAFATSGYSMFEFSDTSGKGVSVALDDIVLLSAADVAQSTDAATPLGSPPNATTQCLEQLTTFLYECTIPPSNACCVTYAAFNAARCTCVGAVRAAGGPDLALAPLLAEPAVCNIPSLVLQDSPVCFQQPNVSTGAGQVVNVLQAGAAPPPPPIAAAPAPAALSSSFELRQNQTATTGNSSISSTAGGASNKNAARLRLVGPYIAIVAGWTLATAAAVWLMARRVERMLRLGTADDGLATEERLLKPLLASK